MGLKSNTEICHTLSAVKYYLTRTTNTVSWLFVNILQLCMFLYDLQTPRFMFRGGPSWWKFIYKYRSYKFIWNRQLCFFSQGFRIFYVYFFFFFCQQEKSEIYLISCSLLFFNSFHSIQRTRATHTYFYISIIFFYISAKPSYSSPPVSYTWVKFHQLKLDDILSALHITQCI